MKPPDALTAKSAPSVVRGRGSPNGGPAVRPGRRGPDQGRRPVSATPLPGPVGHKKATSGQVDDPEFLSHQHVQRTRAGTRSPGASRPGGSGQPRRLLTLVEAADLLGVSVASVRRLIWRGDLPTVRLTRRIQVDGRDLERLIERAKARGGHE
jgi:excisionase family DNA binding protein